MPELRRMLPSSNALFVFDAAARNGSFTAAAAELNVTQPAVSRMLGQFEDHLGVRLFDRKAGRAVLTEEGELLYRRVLDGFRSIETGLIEIERRRKGTETVTLSVSSAFTTHWLMPRIDKLQRSFPNVDLRFQLISGALRGPVENVDLGMRFRDRDEPYSGGTLVMKEVMLPVCSPSYMSEAEPTEGNTIIRLAETPGDWATDYPSFLTKRCGPAKSLSFSDYAVVVQAGLLGQGIALGWLTVTSHWLLTGALVPASDVLTTTRRICEFLPPRNRPMRPIAAEIRDWIIEQMHGEIAQIDRLYPRLELMDACY
ncbi:LysR family transcriptional regulator [Bradyrhizobium guangdongense]|uniref:LysR family transcriptional regulator n=1 Tax=Bradyrhizobium guangdongense TaxID=1325090 RepID=UPI00112D03F0|nr:LysR family transcriptional regulator [Bradyrhizobium guangdongense]TPQ34055.1 LysR family transcriptional regulator [Bradyrhizobium guangdongense]